MIKSLLMRGHLESLARLPLRNKEDEYMSIKRSMLLSIYGDRL